MNFLNHGLPCQVSVLVHKAKNFMERIHWEGPIKQYSGPPDTCGFIALNVVFNRIHIDHRNFVLVPQDIDKWQKITIYGIDSHFFEIELKQ